MRSYRLYCLDGAGHIVSADWIEAESLEAALGAAKGLCRAGVTAELWDGNRPLARLDLQPG